MSSGHVLPAAIAHADWSANEDKRVVARAYLEDDGETYRALAPEQAGDGDLITALHLGDRPDGPALIAFDFPIGVPRVWAARADVDSFLELLPQLGEGRWSDFADVAGQPGEISIERPFYPRDSDSGARRSHLTSALDLEWQELYRRCDRGLPGDRDAAPLFWTVGAQQVGKASLHGWTTLLQPAVTDGEVKVWPYDGDLPDLLAGDVVVAEAYPRSYHDVLAVDLSGSKRHQHHRRTAGPALRSWAIRSDVTLDDSLRFAIDDGFGTARAGEDAFDAVVGLFGVIASVRAGVELPEEDSVRHVEGWILGLDP